MRWRKYAAITLGIMSALLAGEIGLRLVPNLPEPIRMPSPEMEVKYQHVFGERFDVIFLGTSMTEAAVDPDLLPVDAYNSAMPFMTPGMAEIWFDRAVGVTYTPRVVVLGIPAWRIPENLELLGSVEAAFDGWHGRQTFLALQHERGFAADWERRRARDRTVSAALWTDRGHQTAFHDGSGRPPTATFTRPGLSRMDDQTVAAIERLARRIKQGGGQLVLMVEPGRFPRDLRQGYAEEYLSDVELFARRTGVVLWDTYSINWDASLFVDSAHFNREGTVEFSTLIGQLLGELQISKKVGA